MKKRKEKFFKSRKINKYLTRVISSLVDAGVKAFLEKQKPRIDRALAKANKILDRFEAILPYLEILLEFSWIPAEIKARLAGRTRPKTARPPSPQRGATRPVPASKARTRSKPQTKKKPRPKTKPRTGVKAKKVCSTRGCTKPARARGLCSAHYAAARRKGKLK